MNSNPLRWLTLIAALFVACGPLPQSNRAFQVTNGFRDFEGYWVAEYPLDQEGIAMVFRIDAAGKYEVLQSDPVRKLSFQPVRLAVDPDQTGALLTETLAQGKTASLRPTRLLTSERLLIESTAKSLSGFDFTARRVSPEAAEARIQRIQVRLDHPDAVIDKLKRRARGRWRLTSYTIYRNETIIEQHSARTAIEPAAWMRELDISSDRVVYNGGTHSSPIYYNPLSLSFNLIPKPAGETGDWKTFYFSEEAAWPLCVYTREWKRGNEAGERVGTRRELCYTRKK
ncbi:MAG: hypothetical protein AB7F66_06970 [Bacteriovoracia bacterium]